MADVKPLPKSAEVVRTVEMHTGGEPLRIVVSGLPPIVGATLLEKRRYCRQQLDHYRRLLMAEPRGHRDMYGAYLVAPDHPQAHMAALFLHNEGYSTMCGHAMMALARYLVDEGVVARDPAGDTEVNIQCPCGLVRTWLGADNMVRFLSVPAFVLQADLRLPLPDGGTCRLDICYGGAFYAFVRAADVGLRAGSSAAADFVREAARVRRHVAEVGVTVRHPESDDLGFLYGVIFGDFGPLSGAGAPPPDALTLVTVFADGQLDRSPCGSGTTACCALLHAVGRLPADRPCTFRSVTGAEFRARVASTSEFHQHQAVVVEVAGRAFYTGRGEFTCESDDPLAAGFLVL
ncbi:trans-3-hydroxy-L-proline dehydratase-like isoform X2 [Pollicipes pollicipes]|nr:trans-3-hydroxy-L-proline dehydratase-like isoform X2 [Pollicipes pollicipes]XP_037070940.1 trans-3-hydroxy-L-proline dehydratase-like isoform X2 [Pollicipes pollicipes]